MVEYDPNSPLSDEELEALPFEEALDYLDSQAEYLKNSAPPTSQRDMKILKQMSESGYLNSSSSLDK